MVSAQLLDSVAAFFALPALGIAVWMRILFAIQPSDVEVGADGLAWREKRQDRFVSFRDLRAITTEGATLLLHTDDGIERIPFGPVDPALREAVRARVARALARLRPEEAARLEALGRRGRSLAEWKAELQKLFAGGLRSPRVPRVRVIETLDDDGAPPDQRLGAALALVESGDPESAKLARRRAAELAEAVADPHLARAFVELADDALQEETAERLADD
ncbi:MAG TPA: hypothetical protein RMH85_11580 [Polyangiaceae bacterium LLY-WYZ-15_(1-7)]|nr:hypothetical protein [Myxococcales bacterium]MAT25638.1 hypothetical protein [Sandaracinus sp.]HJL01819.1 hypothetical protein [Polyangiaceae bacterium LLY-WYZ-15_(1-7)]MBJ70596.1 hypothetical protein [Sandaracinus sp.]HJL09137.1 hypothetical protein [Polyangiaceae bacterium LLY-WYZ-15_(1-7)]